MSKLKKKNRPIAKSVVEKLRENPKYNKYTCDIKEMGNHPDKYLLSRWGHKVEKGWYGFDLGPAYFHWALAIDKFLHYVNKQCPEFLIHQIKLKFGGIRFYVALNSEDREKVKNVKKEIAKLESWLFDDDLVF